MISDMILLEKYIELMFFSRSTISMKNAVKAIGPIFDILMIPLTYFSSYWLKIIRMIGIERMKVSKKIFII